MARTNSRGRNNNPTGRNQYSSDWMSAVKERPIAAAAVAAASVGAGVFLWSKRNALSEQMSSLSTQISDWTESMRSGSSEKESEMAGAGDSSPSGAATGSTSTRTSRSTGSRATSTRGGTNRSTGGMSETGGGNASLGAHSGSGAGTTS